MGEGYSWVGTLSSNANASLAGSDNMYIESASHLTTFSSGTNRTQHEPLWTPPTATLSSIELEAKISELANSYIPNANNHQPLAAQGLDSLAALELRQKIQEATGLELMTLIEDPEGATIAAIAMEAAAAMQAAVHEQDAGHIAASVNQQPAVVRHQLVPAATSWVAPAPFSVKMRVFCLPYAGGVSENVYGRCVSSRGQNPNIE